MRFLYVQVNDWFEWKDSKYKKVSHSNAKLEGKGKPIYFLKSTQIEPCEPFKAEPKPTPVEKKKETVETLPPISKKEEIQKEV